MAHNQNVGYFIEDLWAHGFRLSDEDIRFIYLGKKMTNVPDWKVIFALRVTIQVQMRFEGSFYFSVLELLEDARIRNERDAIRAIKQRGLEVVS